MFKNLWKNEKYEIILLSYSITNTHMKSRVLLAGCALAAVVSSLSSVNASFIGSGTVVSSGALTTNINWNDAFPGTASGTINGIVIRGRILPVLNMTISWSGVLDLGNLSSTVYTTGSVSIEIGTNAVNGASVTAASTNSGMTNVSSTGNVLNSLSVDGLADSYRFTSVLTGTGDSSAAGFAQSGAISQEINSSAAVTIYSSNKPQNLLNVDDLTFYVSTKPNVQTPAGDYRDVVTVTVTGNF
jgi:hypothetical protein